jgi:hypothetical protein
MTEYLREREATINRSIAEMRATHGDLDHLVGGGVIPAPEVQDDGKRRLETEIARMRLLVQRISPGQSLFRDILLSETLAQLESAIAIEAVVTTINKETEGATEYTKRRKIIPNALICNQVLTNLTEAEGHLDGMALEQRNAIARGRPSPSADTSTGPGSRWSLKTIAGWLSPSTYTSAEAAGAAVSYPTNSLFEVNARSCKLRSIEAPSCRAILFKHRFACEL